MKKYGFILALLLIATPLHAEEEGFIENLCAYATGEKEIDLSPKQVFKELKEVPGELLASLSPKIDSGAETLSDTLEEYKEPVEAGEREGTPSAKVLGATAKNAGIDTAQELAINWKWTMAGLGAVLLVWMFI